MPTYRDPASGKSIRSEKELSLEQLQEAFAPQQQSTPTTTSTTSSTTQTASSGVTDTPGATPTPPSSLNPIPETPGGEVTGNMIRTAAGVGGSVLGGPVGGGAAMLVADPLAQFVEIMQGERRDFNPWRTAAEVALGAVVPGGATRGARALRGALFGVANTSLPEIAEGRLPSAGSTAISAITGATIGAISRNARPAAVKQGVKELTGAEDEITETLIAGKRVAEKDPHVAEMMAEAADANAAAQKIGSTKKIDHALTPDDVDRVTLAELPSKRKMKNMRVSETDTVTKGYLTPMATRFEKMENETGIPIYQDYLLLDQRHAKHKTYINDKAKKILNPIFRGTTAAKRQQYTEWLESPNKEAIEEVYKFSSGDKLAVRRLRKFYDDLFQEFDVDAERYMADYVPHIRKAGSIRDAYPNGVPRQLKPFFEYEREGENFARETDSLRLASRYLRAGSFERHFKDVWEDLADRYGGVRHVKDEATGQMKRISSGVPKEMRQPFTRLMNSIRGNQDAIADRMSRSFTKVAKTMGIDKEVDAREIVNTMTTAAYTNALGFRLGPVLRNSLQPIHTGMPLIGRYLGVGYKQFFGKARNKATKDILESSGILGGESQDIAMLEGIASGRTNRAVDAVARKGLAVFSKMEEVNRGATFLGARQQVIDAAAKAKGNLDKFLNYSDVDMLSDAARKPIEIAYKAGDIEGAAQEYGRYIVRETQFGYSMSERPEALRNVVGRVSGSFAVWPLSYGQYLKKHILAPFWSTNPIVAKKAKARLAKFVAANAAIVGAYREAGEFFGEDEDEDGGMKDWALDTMSHAISPLAYSGSPATQVVMSGAKLASRGVRSVPKLGAEFRSRTNATAASLGLEEPFDEIGDRSPESREFVDSLGIFFNPLHMAQKDVSRAMKEGTFRRRTGRLLGFVKGPVQE